MTTGNNTNNGQTDIAVPGCGFPPHTLTLTVGGFGPYASRVWSGADTDVAYRKLRVPASPVGMVSKESRGPRQYVRTTKNGKPVWVRPITVTERPVWPPRKPKTKRKLLPHAYNVVIRNEFAPLAMRHDRGDDYRRGVIVSPCPKTPAGVDPRQHYKLIEKLRRKVYGSGFHPGIFLAEMPQALRMIGSAATRLRKGLEAAARGSWRGVVRNLLGGSNPGKGSKAYRSFISYRQGKIGLSSFWLEIQYGWLPLIGDIHDGAAYIGYAVGQDFKPTRVSAKREWQEVVEHKPVQYQVCCTRITTKFLARYVITDLKAAPITSLPSLSSLVGVAWEKLPWSFVVDWAVPVSQYLAALRTASDLRGTVVFTLKTHDIHSGFGFDPVYVKAAWLATPVPPRYERITLARTISSEIAPPTPLPDLSPGSVFSDWRRAANAVALLAQFSLGKAYRWHTPIG